MPSTTDIIDQVLADLKPILHVIVDKVARQFATEAEINDVHEQIAGIGVADNG
jgi:hypothetical protein